MWWNRKNNMKTRVLIIFLIGVGYQVAAQSPVEYFNRAANEYIYVNEEVALNTIDAGLNKFPDDQNLINLKEKIDKDKQEQQKQQQEQEQQQNQEQNQEQEQQEQQQEEQEQEQQQQNEEQESEENEDAEQKDQSEQPQQQETEEEGQEMEQPPQSRSEKLEELNLTEEKARMILEAMKNNEIQYIQQNKRKPTKRPDSSKPDW